MNTKGKISIQESGARITPSVLTRMAGVSAILAGLSGMIVGMFHPLNVPGSVTTAAWVNVHLFAVALGFFGLLGMVGLYARQAEKTGWLGLVGFVLFSVWLALMMGFSFVEAFILPHLAAGYPAFVASFLGMFTGTASQVDLGVLPMLWKLSGPMYILGPLLFAIATFRARILARWAAALLAAGSILTPIGAVLPPQYEPRIMVPVGLALAWLGYALFSERREKARITVPDHTAAQPEAGQVA